MKATKFKPHVALHSPKCMRRAAGLLVTHVLKLYEINPLAPELFFLILAHSVYKM